MNRTIYLQINQEKNTNNLCYIINKKYTKKSISLLLRNQTNCQVRDLVEVGTVNHMLLTKLIKHCTVTSRQQNEFQGMRTQQVRALKFESKRRSLIG